MEIIVLSLVALLGWLGFAAMYLEYKAMVILKNQAQIELAKWIEYSDRIKEALDRVLDTVVVTEQDLNKGKKRN